MVEASKRAASTSVCLSSSMVMRPQPLPEVEEISSTPLMRESMASRREVTSISITRDEFPGMLKEIVSRGKVREGESLTGRSGRKASPANARQTKATMMVKADREDL